MTKRIDHAGRNGLGALCAAWLLALPALAADAAAPASAPAAAHAAPDQNGALSATLAYPARDGAQQTVRFATPDAGAALRSYTQASSMQVRQPGQQEISYSESATLPIVRSGNLAFDALFAMAGAEMRQASVAQIRDGSYNGGNPIACECFETGEQWHYVWTRDLSYGAALGLAMLDPQRVRNSLLFKLSPYRAGLAPAWPGSPVAGSADGLQIIQDTGSGGSWPVSTDRVSWAFGAEEALKALAPEERKAFAATAFKALVNTIENDRLAAWDSSDGLYRGEQSFLDWREQSYAAWIVNDLASMATSKALSTNAGHYKALTLAAQLAQEQGDNKAAARYAAWAFDLKRAVNRRLWQADTGLYSSLTAGHFDGAALYKYDWLGQALAIVTGLADQRQALSILSHYPHGPMGAPVIYPQQPGVAVYHNRAIWPFVAAYGLKAAALAGHSGAADAAYQALMRGAALNLSNMENLEWLSGQPWLRDVRQGPPQQDLSGPVINSRRQLWSVGAYLGMVVGEVFGVHTTTDGIALRPFMTATLRRDTFGASDAITLDQLNMHGKRLRIKLLLPPAATGDGYHAVAAVTLNGKAAAATLAWSELAADNSIEIRLGQLIAAPGTAGLHRVDAEPLAQDTAVFAPPEPWIARLTRGAYGLPVLEIAGGAQGALYNIYRDGQLVGPRISDSKWADRTAGLAAPGRKTRAGNACYAVEALYPASGNRSHHSAPVCLDHGVEIGAGDPRVTASGASVTMQEGHLLNWGAPADSFSVRDISVPRSGTYHFQIHYRNTANQINLGISGGVKWMTIKDSKGKTVAQGVVQLPHSQPQGEPAYSTPLTAQLQAGSYRFQLADFYNMSYLQSNTTFSDAGGMQGPSNRVELHGLRVMPAALSTAAGKGASQEDKAAGRGAIRIVEQFASPQLGNRRALRIYLPPGYADQPERRYPVLYMHDGQNLFDAKTAAYGVAWDIGLTMDRLIAAGEIEPAIVVGIDNTKDRIPEYTPCCDPKYGGGKLDAYQRFIIDTVKPYIDRSLRTLPDREHTAIMGSSLGGIASVSIAQQHPEVFSMAAGLSSSFWWNQGDMIAHVPAPSPVRWYIDAGTDQDGLDDTLKMRDAMLAKGYRPGEDLYFYTAQGGIHNEKSWAARVYLPLTWFFAPRSPSK